MELRLPEETRHHPDRQDTTARRPQTADGLAKRDPRTTFIMSADSSAGPKLIRMEQPSSGPV